MDFERRVDLVVAGAGISGVAAGVEAARAGLRVALVEKSILTGGLATAGIVNIYLPLCDGRGTQVTFGIAEELLHASYRYGPGDVPGTWREVVEGKAKARFRVTFSPAAFVLAMDELLQAAGVELWFDTLVCTPIMAAGRVAGVEVENKSGRGILHAKCVIDATGDADVAFRAGAPCEEAENWLSLWSLEASLEAARQAVAKGHGDGLLVRATLGAWNNGQHHPAGKPKYRGTIGRDVSAFVLESRKLLRDRYREARSATGETGRHDFFPLTLPTMAQFRTTRRVLGVESMRAGQDGRHVDTSVGLVADWRKAGHVWEVPLGTLVPRKVDGLLAAGRCIDAAGDAWEVMRVIPAAALTGQAAGVAAALAIRLDTTPAALDPEDVRQEMRSRGIPLHLEDVILSARTASCR